MALDILIIDDEDDIRDLIAGILEDEGYEARQAHDADSGLNEIAKRRPSLVFLDIWMQGSRLDGLQLLDVLQAQHPDMPVVGGAKKREVNKSEELVFLPGGTPGGEPVWLAVAAETQKSGKRLTASQVDPDFVAAKHAAEVYRKQKIEPLR